eukprot:TRINITY_DN5502_c0_g1_i3.p1 TRINITY_DN5502_c0_g1~~TRINITY_DN5502_c0_g1_i3.p1  ORF type:complete len:367 (+),score=72.11 TRINITY_DN5502_c0_g1_i3:118-1218(+)
MGVLDVVLQSLMATVFVVSGLIVTAVQLVTLLLWPFSRKYYRLVNSALVQLHWTQLLWLTEHWAGMKLTVYMDKRELELAKSESSVCLSNHISDVDWLLGWWIADKFNVLGGTKCLLKKELALLPILGWSWWFLEYTYISRDWTKDRDHLHRSLSKLKDYPLRFWEVIYAEGTRQTPEKKAKGMAYCKKNNLPIFKHVMYPRVKGYTVAMEELHKHADSVLFSAFAFPDGLPSFSNLLQRNINHRINVYVKRVPIREVPQDEAGSEQFCVDCYAAMDKELEHHEQHGEFAGHKVDFPASVHTAAIFYSWCVVLAVAAVYLLVTELLIGNWTMLYVAAGILATGPIWSVIAERFKKRSALKTKVKST